MRIFNWVQRTLNPNNFRDSRFGSCVKKSDCVGSGCELDSVLESWKDGILTIGTFGYDPLKHFAQHDHHQQLFPQDWSDDNDDEEEEEDINNHNDAADGKLEEEELNPLIFSKRKEEAWKAEAATADDPSSSADIDDEMTKRTITSKRTTLADLFFAESSLELHKLPLHDHLSSSTVVLPRHIAGEKKKKQLVGTDNSSQGQQSNKVIHPIAAKTENHINPPPVKIKKLHQLMKKILKRKIYPEDVTDAQVINEKKHVQAAESLCLLHTGAAADAMP